MIDIYFTPNRRVLQRGPDLKLDGDHAEAGSGVEQVRRVSTTARPRKSMRALGVPAS